jgi:hypothetical protein
MAKYRRKLKTRKQLRKKLRKTMRRPIKKGGYSPVGPNGGNEGYPITSYPEGQTGALPDPMAAMGVPIGKQVY